MDLCSFVAVSLVKAKKAAIKAKDQTNGLDFKVIFGGTLSSICAFCCTTALLSIHTMFRGRIEAVSGLMRPGIGVTLAKNPNKCLFFSIRLSTKAGSIIRPTYKTSFKTPLAIP